MRGFLLNGWQRIGIVLSILWALIGGLWGRNAALKPFFDCISQVGDLQLCHQPIPMGVRPSLAVRCDIRSRAHPYCLGPGLHRGVDSALGQAGLPALDLIGGKSNERIAGE